MDEYQKTIKEGQERVEELNVRFGDWYYVISDKVYKQIHVGRDQLFKVKKPEDKSADGAPADTSGAGLPGLPDLPIGQ